MLAGLDDYVASLRDGWQSVQRWTGFWGPVVALPPALRPVAILGTLLALVAITGIALSSLALFITSALFLYLLLSQVLGVEVSIAL